MTFLIRSGARRALLALTLSAGLLLSTAAVVLAAGPACMAIQTSGATSGSSYVGPVNFYVSSCGPGDPAYRVRVSVDGSALFDGTPSDPSAVVVNQSLNLAPGTHTFMVEDWYAPMDHAGQHVASFTVVAAAPPPPPPAPPAPAPTPKPAPVAPAPTPKPAPVAPAPTPKPAPVAPAPTARPATPASPAAGPVADPAAGSTDQAADTSPAAEPKSMAVSAKARTMSEARLADLLAFEAGGDAIDRFSLPGWVLRGVALRLPCWFVLR